MFTATLVGLLLLSLIGILTSASLNNPFAMILFMCAYIVAVIVLKPQSR